MSGMVAVVTGGRVRIGYATVLKLLRAGALVVCTTRYPSDAACRYCREADFEVWRARLLIVGPLEMSELAQVVYMRACACACAHAHVDVHVHVRLLVVPLLE